MTQRLFCYVDETGQDTQGQLFVVVAVVTVEPDELRKHLETAEATSGTGKAKWRRVRKGKGAYLMAALSSAIKIRVYYQVFTGPELSYELATVQATANAIDAYRDSEGIGEYNATIVIDGLHRSLQHRTAKLLRNLGIRTKSVRGERDEASPIVRLADAVAGLVRESYEGSAQYQAMRKDLERREVLKKLP